MTQLRRSPLWKKMDRWRRAVARQDEPGRERAQQDDEAADEAADRRMSGGYDTSPGNICPRHHLARSSRGACIECEAEGS